jgi:hypothetical protein
MRTPTSQHSGKSRLHNQKTFPNPSIIFLRDSSHSNALSRKLLRALLLSSLQRSLLHRIICRLIRPELEVFRTISRLTNLPGHPWHTQTIEHSDVICEHLRFVFATCAEFLEKCQFVGCLSTFQSNGAFGPEFFDATVGVQSDEIECFASPVFRDVGVREFVASSCWWCQFLLYAIDYSVRRHSPVDTSTLLSPMSRRMNLDRSHHQFGTGAVLLSRWPWPSF